MAMAAPLPLSGHKTMQMHSHVHGEDPIELDSFLLESFNYNVTPR
jgi:hypothetical protein